MSHSASSRFWRLLDGLPNEVQRLARENYELLKIDPKHPSLHFKRVGKYFSVRAGLSYRALGAQSQDDIIWFWIGEHDEYQRIVRRS